MNVGAFKPNPKIAVAAGIIECVVPDYDIKQSDPLLAAESGTGNCMSKAVLGALLLERAELVGPTPSVAWNKRTHPKHTKNLFGRIKTLNGHVQLLTADLQIPPTITALSFNPDSKSSSNWEIFDFNEVDDYATVENNKIVATPVGKSAGFIISNWYNSGKAYQEAIGQKESSFHKYSEEQLRDKVVDLLVQRDVISSFVNIDDVE